MASHTSSAESAVDIALSEEAPLQNPQADQCATDGVSNLAFAARIFQPDPQEAFQKTVSGGAPAVDKGTPTQAVNGLQASSESVAEAAADQTAASGGPAEPTNASQLAIVATKAVLASGEPRNQNTHTGQSDPNISIGDAAPRGSDRDSAPSATTETKETAAARPVEPEQLPAPPVSHDVSLRLGDGQNNVDIRLSERAGEIRVTVHTPEGNLANSMRSELPDLVGKLRQTGYQAETWRPAGPPQADGERRSGTDSSPQQQWSGGRRDGRQSQQQQQQNKPRWVGEWNMSLDPGQEPSR